MSVSPRLPIKVVAVDSNDDPVYGYAAAPSTATISSVNDTNASTTLLAANTSRKGASIFNDSTEVLYVALGNVTASSTNFTVKLAAGAYYELPVCAGGVYTGIIKGIWANDSTGAARVTEMT
jgi:hypothetical protein